MWQKLDAFSWKARTTRQEACIDKVSGNLGLPYMWVVRPLPRPDGRWNCIARGACRKLAEAKAEAEKHIT